MKTIPRWMLLAALFVASLAWACAALFFDSLFSGWIAAVFALAAAAIVGWDYLYYLRANTETIRKVLLAYLEEINQLAERPRWYDAFRYNCTTAIRHHIQSVTPGSPFNWRILLNGRLDELGYQQGTIDTSMPFEELRMRSNITERARAIEAISDFSTEIRRGLSGHGYPSTQTNPVSAEPQKP